MFRNLRHMVRQNYEEEVIDRIYPNPDNMTYEELLELQSKIGYVSKGLTEDQINVDFINLEYTMC